MKKTTTKTSTTRNNIHLATQLVSDSDVLFGEITGDIDTAHPLGMTSFSVYDQESYQENKADAKAAYATFCSLLESYTDDFVGTVTTEEIIDNISD